MGNARKTLRSAMKPAASGRRARAAALVTLESVPVPVVVVDGLQRIVFVNQHVVHEFGYATAELVGEALSQLVRESLRGRGWLTFSEGLRCERATA